MNEGDDDMNAIQIGPAIIQQSWIVIGTGLITGYLLLTYNSPFKGEKGKELRETIGNSVFIFILTFLFGTFVLQIDLVFQDPIAVISYPSGVQELYLATIFTTMYLIFSSMKKKVALIQYVHGLLYFLLVANLLFEFWVQRKGSGLLGETTIIPWNNHPISLYMIVVSAVLLVILLKIQLMTVEKSVIIIFVTWTVALNITGLLDDYPVYFGIPVTQLFYVFLLTIAVGLVALKLLKNMGVYK